MWNALAKAFLTGLFYGIGFGLFSLADHEGWRMAVARGFSFGVFFMIINLRDGRSSQQGILKNFVSHVKDPWFWLQLVLGLGSIVLLKVFFHWIGFI